MKSRAPLQLRGARKQITVPLDGYVVAGALSGVCHSIGRNRTGLVGCLCGFRRSSADFLASVRH